MADTQEIQLADIMRELRKEHKELVQEVRGLRNDVMSLHDNFDLYAMRVPDLGFLKRNTGSLSKRYKENDAW